MVVNVVFNVVNFLQSVWVTINSMLLCEVLPHTVKGANVSEVGEVSEAKVGDLRSARSHSNECFLCHFCFLSCNVRTSPGVSYFLLAFRRCWSELQGELCTWEIEQRCLGN